MTSKQVANMSSMTNRKYQGYKCVFPYFTYKQLRNMLSGHRRETDGGEMGFSISTLSEEEKDFLFSCRVT